MNRNTIQFLASLLCMSIISIIFLWIVIKLISSGLSSLNYEFLSTLPENAGRDGGILSVIVSTFMIVGICILFSLPLSLMSALYLSEYCNKASVFYKITRYSLELLSGVPSIVFGLFGLTFFCYKLGLGFSILSGALTLGCMVIPLMLRTLEDSFNSVPQHLRLQAQALNLSKITTIKKIIIPYCLKSIGICIILGIGRALAETAALLFTSGYVTRMPSSIFDSGRTLSIHIYDLALNVPGGDKNAAGTALTLLLILLLINSFTSIISNKYNLK